MILEKFMEVMRVVRGKVNNLTPSDKRQARKPRHEITKVRVSDVLQRPRAPGLRVIYHIVLLSLVNFICSNYLPPGLSRSISMALS